MFQVKSEGKEEKMKAKQCPAWRPLGRESSFSPVGEWDFYFIHAFNWLYEAHPPQTAQSTLLSLLI